MNKTKKNIGICLVLIMILCAAVLTGCRNYEVIDLPSVETAEADIPLKETQQNSSEEAQSSAMKPGFTTETAPEVVAVDETVYVTGDYVNLRSNRSAASEAVAQVNKGDTLHRVGYSETWSKVIYQEKECYISSQYVSLSKPEPETTAAVTETVSGDKGKLIAIDAGHQAKGNSEKEPIGPGSDTKKAKVASGATGVSTKLPEYKLTLTVSLKLKEELKSRGYQVYMIRETHDVNISNAERAEMANHSGADIFVRIHGNSLNDSSVHGVLTMNQTSKNPYNGNLYSKSSALSRNVVDGISKTTGAKNKGIQETDSMSGINWCKTPVTIVEMGFMSNPEEDKLMSTDDYQNKIVKGIADGIDAYYAAGN